MRLGACAIAIVAAIAMSQASLAEQDLSVTISEIDLPGNVVEISAQSGAVLVRTDLGETLVLHGHPPSEAEAAVDGQDAERAIAYEAQLPQSLAAHGNGDIRISWLSDATDRYQHGVLGDRLEAAALRIRRRNGAEFVLAAGNDAVFEDLTPRLADLDGNGEDEIIVVKSYLDRGAALAVIGLRAGGLEILDETPPIGRRNRWLNPVGAADFDGDGRMEIAYVETPHIGGRLMIWEWHRGALRREHALTGFSNHAIGSTELGLSAIVDVDGDGLMDIAVPGRHRDRMRLIGFAGGEPEELANIPLDGTVATAIAPVGGHLVFGLEDGRLMALPIPRP